MDDARPSTAFAPSKRPLRKRPDSNAFTTPIIGDNNVQSLACAYRNICVFDWRHRNPPGPIEMFLLGDSNEANLGSQTLEALQACLHTSITGRKTTFTSRSPPARPQWRNGTTALVLKFEPRSHPAAWVKAWAALLSAVTWEGDVLGVQSVEHVQLVDQDYPLNGWEEFIMHTTLAAIHAVSSNRTEPTKWPSALGSTVAPAFFGGLALAKVDDESPICFERALAARPLSTDYIIPRPPPSSAYFVSHQEAEAFRAAAYRALGFQYDLAAPRSRDAVRVVLIQRDRTLWNENALLALLESRGLKGVLVAEISERMPFFQQAGLFYQADVLITVHGSQLANQVFMRHGRGVIELSPPLFFHNEPQLLGRVMGLNVVTLTGTSLPPQSLVESLRPDMVDHLHHCTRLASRYPTVEACSAVFECRDSMRRLGAYVDLDSFAEVVEGMVQRVLSAG